jgi:glutamine amidotransferase
LQAKLQEVNQTGKLNCLLSDGRRLFCYHDANGWKGLTFRPVYLLEHSKRTFGDPTLQVDLEGDSVTYGIVVATTPLSSTGWESFQPGELMVLEEGAIRFSSHGTAHGLAPVGLDGEALSGSR